MYLYFIDVFVFYCGDRHVSGTHIAIFRVIYLITRLQLWLKCAWITPRD